MTNLEEEEGCMEVRNLSYICSTYADMASPIKPADTVKDEIEIFLAITNGPGKENYVYPTGTFQAITTRIRKNVQLRRRRMLSGHSRPIAQDYMRSSPYSPFEVFSIDENVILGNWILRFHA